MNGQVRAPMKSPPSLLKFGRTGQNMKRKHLLASRIMRETFSWQKAAEVFVGIIEKRFGLFQVSLNI